MKKGIYKHYKGDEYEVIGLAQHSETLEKLVVYRPLYKSDPGFEEYWVRPLSMFIEEVEVGGNQVQRFTYISAYEQ